MNYIKNKLNSVSILGSTGSIGTQTLEICKELNIKVSAISGNKNINLLERQIRLFKPKIAAVLDESLALVLKNRIGDSFTKILSGQDGICEVATNYSSDMVVSAISGVAGLIPTSEAIKSGKNIALANKEVLVTGGKLITDLAKQKKVKLLPVDSEHSAIFQCLQANSNNNKNNVKKLILTASGGPFFSQNTTNFEQITPEEALKHPNWSMGKKISIDSATMINKGLEIIEAAHLFDFNIDNIGVIVHKESIIHSMIEFQDGSFIAQLSTPSMKIPIQYALTYPNHIKNTQSNIKNLDLVKLKNLSFYGINQDFFQNSINICKQAFKSGLSSCVILNSANEKAVELFLNNKIKFTDIIKIIKFSLEKFESPEITRLEQVELLDKKVKNNIENYI